MPWAFNQPRSVFHLGLSTFGSGTRSNTPVNAAYSHLVSGTAVAHRFRSLSTGSLQRYYVFLDATTGTRANVTMSAFLYQGNNTASIARPGNTLIASATGAVLPASDDRWIEFVFSTPPTINRNTVYWLVMTNTSAAPTVDFPLLLTGRNFLTNNTMQDNAGHLLQAFTTTNGFTTAGTAAQAFGVAMVSGSAFGNPFTALNNTPFTSNTLRHGAILNNDIRFFRHVGAYADGWVGPTGGHNVIEIQDATQPPGSGVQFSETTTPFTVAESVSLQLFNSPVVLSGSNDFVLSFRSATGQTTPSAIQIEGFADYPTMFNQFFDGWQTPQAVQEVGGVWSTIPGVAARVHLIPDQLQIPSAGGLKLFPGLNGGMDG